MKDGKLVPIRRVASFSGAFPELKDKIDSFVEEHKINTIMSLDQVDVERLIQFTNILLTQ
jgi:fatty acid-binding protein DegV